MFADLIHMSQKVGEMNDFICTVTVIMTILLKEVTGQKNQQYTVM